MLRLNACGQLPEVTAALYVFPEVHHLEREHAGNIREDALDCDDPHFLVCVDVRGVVAILVSDRDALVCDGFVKIRNADHVAGEVRAAGVPK